jgi:hypothetical protein
MKPKKSTLPMEINPLDFVEQYRDLVKQALGKHAGEPASARFALWKHIVLYCLWLEEDFSYRETPNRLKYMGDICDTLLGKRLLVAS